MFRASGEKSSVLENVGLTPTAGYGVILDVLLIGLTYRIVEIQYPLRKGC